MAISLNTVNSEVVRAHKRIDTLESSNKRFFYGLYSNHTGSKSIKISKKFKHTLIYSGNNVTNPANVMTYTTVPITSNISISESTLYYDDYDDAWTYHHVNAGGGAYNNWMMIIQFDD